jgi:hypothetical protein
MSANSDLSPEEAWMLAGKISEVLLDSSVVAMLSEPEFTDFLGGNSQPSGRIIT